MGFYNILAQAVPGDAIPDDDGSGATLIIRGGIFLICLLVFVVVCGYIWRKSPTLRSFIPSFKPGQSSLEARLAEQKRQHEDEIHMQKEAKTTNSTVIAPPDLGKRPTFNPANSSLTLTPLQRPQPEALPLASELASNDKRIEAALADGTPGSVVRAASDLDGSIHHAPIMIVQREDEAD